MTGEEIEEKRRLLEKEISDLGEPMCMQMFFPIQMVVRSVSEDAEGTRILIKYYEPTMSLDQVKDVAGMLIDFAGNMVRDKEHYLKKGCRL